MIQAFTERRKKCLGHQDFCLTLSRRNDSVIADYKLTFLMPEEEQNELTNFTLSREVVYNVFRQFLYDQDPDESRPMYIDPVSLTML